MAKAYWIANVTVTNPDNYADYQILAPKAFQAYGARFIARGGRNEALEGRESPQRTVVIEFPSYQHAYNCYHSEAYKKARQARRGASEVDILIVEGL
ncbi:DUF1330 domain-containing protein [uncultured Marinobacter sp.]|jgi:uncharacterized protein (DUF1330 family)|uniref:DUF1330 domain-containing protein n=1 Tax=Marinobacter sp. M5B TaxID=3141535 RepID=UPI00258D4D4E|nr:DUF1330 domain-containing protein [uncultured Marinobacter sp.]|tara:strand:- start:321 stop:611 length:291 start_codon:yes stop_codon:yes gene_type:complete